MFDEPVNAVFGPRLPGVAAVVEILEGVLAEDEWSITPHAVEHLGG